ncbi:DUF2087 domain-containing protein [Pseudoneobacillus rhizosphaerae]|uniref:DUF2087 domain-containing protein n=1 Tax=Pseudoneobacillus rhizosphaerae TaxID=2880968 RepID=A0A9C7LCJ3_9BACI|nr:DUF2087 domain-containing protein [Pseudoneobacillus rhizosphaerae]CAG9610377.1 hypothetical protein NEOCIP111885_04151 [Pseudoneobacillus rhizosphaerae]
MQTSEQFWNASPEELKKGYIEESEHYLCLLCGKKIEKGIIYPEDDVLYEAERFTRLHIEKDHQSVFNYLINLDKKLTGLTDHQSRLLRLFFEGKTDTEVQKEMEIGSAATIRNHRFVLKEKERQARVFLTMMELLKEKDQHAPKFLPPHKTAKMIDDRYNVTEKEREGIIKKYFPEGPTGPLSKFPLKEKQKLVVLMEIAKGFYPEHIYDEKETNEILQSIYDDYVILRRYLIEYGFLDRKNDGSQYWLKK